MVYHCEDTVHQPRTEKLNVAICRGNLDETRKAHRGFLQLKEYLANLSQSIANWGKKSNLTFPAAWVEFLLALPPNSTKEAQWT